MLLLSVIAMIIFVIVYLGLRRKVTKKINDEMPPLTSEQANRRLMSQCDEKQYSLRRFKQ